MAKSSFPFAGSDFFEVALLLSFAADAVCLLVPVLGNLDSSGIDRGRFLALCETL